MLDGWLSGADRRWVRREKAEDRAAIRTVNIEAFEQENEADLVDALRKESATFLSFVAGEDDHEFHHLRSNNTISNKQALREYRG